MNPEGGTLFPCTPSRVNPASKEMYRSSLWNLSRVESLDLNLLYCFARNPSTLLQKLAISNYQTTNKYLNHLLDPKTWHNFTWTSPEFCRLQHLPYAWSHTSHRLGASKVPSSAARSNKPAASERKAFWSCHEKCHNDPPKTYVPITSSMTFWIFSTSKSATICMISDFPWGFPKDPNCSVDHQELTMNYITITNTSCMPPSDYPIPGAFFILVLLLSTACKVPSSAARSNNDAASVRRWSMSSAV